MRRYSKLDDNGAHQWKQCALIITVIILFTIAALGFAAFWWYAANFGSVLWTISGVSPVNGNVAVAGGAGVTTVPGTGDVVIDNNNVRDTLLPNADPMGTQVTYYVAINGPQNTWLMGPAPGFTPFLLPGILPGDDGQGNGGGITWTVPAPGQYSVHVTCENTVVGTIVPADTYQYRMSLQLNAIYSSPNSGPGWEPFSGSAADAVPTSGGSPIVTTDMSVAASFQAGCAGCPVDVGAPLTIHLQLRHLGFYTNPTVSTSTGCYITVTREK